MLYGYRCDDCGEIRLLATPKSELVWLRNRVHIVREVARHTAGGLDLWMSDGLAFLEDHADHSVVIISAS